MYEKKRNLEHLAKRLDLAQNRVISLRANITLLPDSPEKRADLASLYALLDLGSRMNTYMTLLLDGKTEDISSLSEIEEFCKLAESLGSAALAMSAQNMEPHTAALTAAVVRLENAYRILLRAQTHLEALGKTHNVAVEAMMINDMLRACAPLALYLALRLSNQSHDVSMMEDVTAYCIQVENIGNAF